MGLREGEALAVDHLSMIKVQRESTIKLDPLSKCAFYISGLNYKLWHGESISVHSLFS